MLSFFEFEDIESHKKETTLHIDAVITILITALNNKESNIRMFRPIYSVLACIKQEKEKYEYALRKLNFILTTSTPTIKDEIIDILKNIKYTPIYFSLVNLF